MCEFKCWLDKQALRDMIAFANAKHPLETGGTLCGYRLKDDNKIVITNVTGPGPDADHQRYSFLADHKYNQVKNDEIFYETKGHLRFIGDWHTHPNGPCDYSPADFESMFKIVNCIEAKTPNPVMLILGYDYTQFKVWEFRDNILSDMPVKMFDYRKAELMELIKI